MTRRSIVLSEDANSVVEARVASGDFGSDSEYIERLVREDGERAEKSRIEQVLLARLHSSEPDIEVTPEYWRQLKQRVFGEKRPGDQP